MDSVKNQLVQDVAALKQQVAELLVRAHTHDAPAMPLPAPVRSKPSVRR